MEPSTAAQPITGAEVLTALRNGPFHLALRAAIDARGLTLARLQDRLAQRGLHVSLTSLSYWQHGRSQPERPDSLRALTVLEQVLDVPAGSLLALLGPRRPRGPRALRVTAADRPEEVLGAGAPLSALFDRLPGSRQYDLDLSSQHEVVTLNSRGATERVSNRILAVARRDGVDRYYAAYQGDDGCDVDRVEIVPGTDCRLGRVLRDGANALVVAELLFGAELRHNETYLFDFDVVDDTAALTTVHGHGFRCRVDQFVLQVRFHSAALPSRVYGFAQPVLADEELCETGDLVLSAHHTAHLSATGLLPGGIGIAWTYP